MKKKLAFMLLAIIIVACLSACEAGPAYMENEARFIRRAYWFDNPNATLDLVFYYMGEPFAAGMEDISSCAIVSAVNGEFDCELIEYELADEPIYKIGGADCYQGRLCVKFRDLQSSIADASLSMELKDGTEMTCSIGSISYSAIDEAANEEARAFIEYALINPAIYAGEDEIPGTAAIALEMQVRDNLIITNLIYKFEQIGLDLQRIAVYPYDEYISHISAPLDNMELDKIIDGIYERKTAGNQNSGCGIALDPGRYVLLIPVAQSSEDVLEPVFAGLDIEFDVEGRQYSMHVSCNPLFTENFHSIAEVTALFEN